MLNNLATWCSELQQMKDERYNQNSEQSSAVSMWGQELFTLPLYNNFAIFHNLVSVCADIISFFMFMEETFFCHR